MDGRDQGWRQFQGFNQLRDSLESRVALAWNFQFPVGLLRNSDSVGDVFLGEIQEFACPQKDQRNGNIDVG